MQNLELSKNQRLALYVAIFIASVFIIGGFLQRYSNRNNSAVTLYEQGKSPNDLSPYDIDSVDVQQSGKVIVHVTGCVKKPGVYTLDFGSRINDAIKAAGGATPDAYLDGLNLAQKLKDGEKIVVLPKASDNQINSPGKSLSAFSIKADTRFRSNSYPGSDSNAGGIVNINTAGIAELDNLPGIGPATAQKIIEYREQIGRFTSVEQLLDVKGIGPKKLEKMRPYVSL